MKNRRKQYLFVVRKEQGQLTATAVHWIENDLSRIVYQSLKTNYQSSGSPYLLPIMASAQDYFRRTANDEYKRDVEQEHDGEQTQRAVKHDHVFRYGMTLEIEPYSTLETTDYWTDYSKDTKDSKTEPCITFEDLLMVGWEEALVLNERGLLIDRSSLWCLRRFVYRAISRELNRYRRNETREVREVVNHDGELLVLEYRDEKSEQPFANAETMEVITQLELIVKNQLPKRMDKECAWIVWLNVSIYGQTKKQIAKSLNVDEKQVRRWYESVLAIVSKWYGMD